MTTLIDSIIDVDGTLLDAHSGECNASITKHGNSGSGTVVITGNRAAHDGSGNDATYYWSGFAATQNFLIEASLTNYGGNLSGKTVALCALMDTSSDTHYEMRFEGTGTATCDLRFYKVVSGTSTVIANFFVGGTFATGDSWRIRFSGSGVLGSYTLQYNNLVARFTDSSITAAGRLGVYFAGSASSTTGWQLSSVVASTPVLLDSFTDADGTTLTAHTGEIGATWTQISGFTGIFKVQSNRLYKDHATDSGTALYMPSAVFSSPDMIIDADWYIASTAAFYSMIRSRESGLGSEAMEFRYAAATAWQLQQEMGGETQIGSNDNYNIVAGDTHQLRIESSGAIHNLWASSTTGALGNRSAALNTVIQHVLTGRHVAIRCDSGGSTTTGIHVGSIMAFDLHPRPVSTASPTVNACQLVRGGLVS